jgi:hypothetical protein
MAIRPYAMFELIASRNGGRQIIPATNSRYLQNAKYSQF